MQQSKYQQGLCFASSVGERANLILKTVSNVFQTLSKNHQMEGKTAAGGEYARHCQQKEVDVGKRENHDKASAAGGFLCMYVCRITRGLILLQRVGGPRVWRRMMEEAMAVEDYVLIR